MVCPDYDLCGICEAKNLHPGCNFIRIASPQANYPRHFMNRLHRMSKRAGSCNGDYENTRPSFWNPRPQSCRPDWAKTEMSDTMRAEVAKKVREMKEVKSQAKEMKKEVKEMRKEMKKEEKKASSGLPSTGLPTGPWQLPEEGMPKIPPMTFELQDQGGNVLHAGDLGNLNQLSGLVGMANHFNQHFGEHFGTPMTPVTTPNPNVATASNLADLLQQVFPEAKKDEKNDEKASGNLNEEINKKESTKEEFREIKIQKEDPISCQTCEAPPFPSEKLFKSHMITVHETEDASTNKEDDEWTLLDKATTPEKENKPSAPSSESEEPAQGASGTLYPSLDEQEPKKTQGEVKEPEAKKKPDYSNLRPKVRVAIEAMENMGFSNEDGWLTNLLEKYDGDIGKVLDLLQPVKPVRT